MPTSEQVFSFELTSGTDTPTVSQTKQNVLGSITFDAIPYTLDDAGKTYQYTVKETSTDGGGLTTDKTVYTVTVEITDNKDGTLHVTPTIYNGTDDVDELLFNNVLLGNLIVTKTVSGSSEPDESEFAFGFTFENDQGEALQERFPFTGSRTGYVGHGDTLMLKDGERIEVSGIPFGTECGVAEEESIRYTVSVNGEQNASCRVIVDTENVQVDFVNNLVTTDFTVYKEWQGGGGGAITLTLYANGQKLDPQPSYSHDEDTYRYDNLPMYDANGMKIVYSAKERYMDGFMTIYQNIVPYESETKSIYDGGTIINRAVTDIAVRKVWTGMGENEDHPEITLTLYCNGQVINKTPKVDKDGWYHFYNLPIRSQPYYVIETPIDGYATTYENKGAHQDETDRVYDGGTITNHKIPKTQDNSHGELYLAIMLLCLIGLALCIRGVFKQK